ncbi:MAG: orotidine-5'-phosphate decarboxylase [Desulfovibrionales bacterium]
MAELIVALDYPEPKSALEMVHRLRDVTEWFKVGLELYTAAGPSIVESVRNLGGNVFLDLKFMDIPNTVKGAVRSGTNIGAQIMTLHLLGGQDMIQAGLEGRDQAVGNTLLFGVTLLTSMDIRDLPCPLGSNTTDLIVTLAEGGVRWGMDGVVCSGLEVGRIRRFCPRDFLCLTPGIRRTNGSDDQKRIVTPEEAVRGGADFLVVGRPITGADDPEAEAVAFAEAIRSASPALT